VTLAGHLKIDLDALVANWRSLDALSPPSVETAAVVKANAYGCGAEMVGPALVKAGVRTFFAAQPSEGVILRQAIGPGPVIYILGGNPVGREAGLYPAHDLRAVLNTLEQYSDWMRDRKGAPCAVQIDSGMNRLGLEADEFEALGPLPDCVQLVISHLACADEPEHPLNASQLTEFRRLTKGLNIPLSLAATGGILLGGGFHQDMTRAGVGMYGGLPFARARRVVDLHLPIIQLRTVIPGEYVGYGGTWRAQRVSRVATISGGYADGLNRALGNGAVVFIDGQPVPFAGRVSMDLITIDVTDCPQAALGTMVELLGPHQSVDDLAAAAGTIGYEILTSLGSRYTRRYTCD